ncbi:microcystin-dependent protein [Lewinella marina]|uniref:Phage tail protein n=1 Tax=Neolewinella marina TaxID=438751 RepID=A0A2G0CCQ3_9BACT|nr:tail fiber protein [Neolewinella marina]NJB87563.1 microcystin-dependent protein [Neolewinella marina]PHK97745.1 phage tail protein [Neolewinella marina]
MEPFIAMIVAFGGNFAPRGWAFCDGQILAIAQNQALFSLIGTTYGGDGRSTFGLPDLRGRSIVHPGSGAGLSPIRWGEKGGLESMTLTQNQMPPHSHLATLQLGQGVGTSANGNDQYLAFNAAGETPFTSSPPTGSAALGSQTVSVGSAGGGQPIPVRSPYQGIHYIIALTGIFPSRS